MTDPAILERFNCMSLEAKLALLHELWSEVLGELEHRPATDAEKRFLDERLQALENDEREDRGWDDVREDLLGA
jgi:hypothetical protein